MSYSKRMQENNLYSVYLAPRGRVRMVDLGMQIAQQYLSPFDHIIGVIGDAGSGKSMLIRGMFPGLDLTNDDGGGEYPPPASPGYPRKNLLFSSYLPCGYPV